MKSKTCLGILAIMVSIMLLFGAFTGGLLTGRYLWPASDSVASDLSTLLSDNGKTGEREELFKPFWQAWDIVHEQFVEQPVDDTALMRGAISGMLKSLGDEHTGYVDPDMAKRFDALLNGEEYEGIGAWIDITGEYVKIISPMPDSPAEKAGLQPGDLVIAVDGEDMTGIDGELVRKRIIGPKGTEVLLTIRREGVEEPLEFTIKRAAIIEPTIQTKILEENIAYVRLFSFGGQTANDLRDALKKLLANEPSGLILDLRYNGGGLLGTAIQVASEFIPDGVVMQEQFGDGQEKIYQAEAGGLATEIPLVVLVNEGSASASEIVAGAIQDQDRGKLVGVTTYGKGSVQTVVGLVDDQGQIRVTIARWLTPNGRQINKLGLTPDVEVQITEEDAAAGRDTQLERAIELLQQQ